MMAYCNCLWIGTNIGSILRLPVPSITPTDVDNNSTSTCYGKGYNNIMAENQLKWTRLYDLRLLYAIDTTYVYV